MSQDLERRESRIDHVPRSEVFRAGVDLIIASNEWTMRYISQFFTVQAVIAGAEGVLFGIGGAPFPRPALVWFLQIALAVLGIISAWVLVDLYDRDKDWQGQYTLATRRAEGENPLLYPDQIVQPLIHKTGAYGTKRMAWLRWSVSIGWGILALLVLSSTPGGR